MKVAVVGHIEWCEFAKVHNIPVAGEIVRATKFWNEAAGGGGVAAVQLLQLAGNCTLFTAVGNDDVGKQAIKQLSDIGVEVYASIIDDQPTKKAFVHIDSNKERSITVLGGLRPSATDKSLPWEKLEEMDAVYYVSGDSMALLKARKAKVLVSTSRILNQLKESPIVLDALVMSMKDTGETYNKGDLDNEPLLIVKTAGKDGSFIGNEHYSAEFVTTDDFKDSYGCGDSFAAGLTFGLAQGLSRSESVKLATHSGALAAMRYGAHGLSG